MPQAFDRPHAGSSNHPTGYWAEEALKAYERFVAAGADVVVITPDGQPPVPDPYSLERAPGARRPARPG